MATGRKGGEGICFVKFVGGGNANHVEVGFGQHLFGGGITAVYPVLIPHRCQHLLIQIRNRHHLSLGVGCIAANMPLAHPQPNHTYT